MVYDARESRSDQTRSAYPDEQVLREQQLQRLCERAGGPEPPIARHFFAGPRPGTRFRRDLSSVDKNVTVAGQGSWPTSASSLRDVFRRRPILFALGALAAAPAVSLTPSGTSKKEYRIGLLHSESALAVPHRIQALKEGLREFGYVEGRNLAIEFRWAEGQDQRLPSLAAELVRLNVDVIVTTATQPTLVAKQATQSIPIVFANVGDAVATGVVESLAHPGGNATGSTFFSPEIMAKRLELSKRVIPGLGRVAVLLNPDSTLGTAVMSAMGPIANALSVEIRRFDARSPAELDEAVPAMSRQGMQAVIMHDHPRFIANRQRIATLAIGEHLAAIGYDELAESGGLFGYGVNFTDLWRRAAYFVDRIFKGARPDQLPVEQATRFDFAINARTARTLGISIPTSVLVSADRVLE